MTDPHQTALAALAKHGSIRAAARAQGMNYSTFYYLLQEARALDGSEPPPVADDWQAGLAEPAFEYPEIPDDDLPYEELKALAKADFARLDAHKQAIKLLKVKIKLDGPYGILAMGDPHVDSDGADWPLLDRHTQLTRRVPGLFGANVGDITNNWIGRLGRLYGEQNMGKKRGLKLAAGWLREVRWLWIDPGNHDMWSGADDPVAWITRAAGVHYKWQGSRLELVAPRGASIIVNSRHDHPGHSMYHPTHGPLKASIFDGVHDDVYTCGHIHSGAYHLHMHPTGRVSHLLRLSSYKVYDSHKDAKGFLDAHLPAGVFIVNPEASTNHGRIVFCADPEQGADILTLARRRYEAGRTVTLHPSDAR